MKPPPNCFRPDQCAGPMSPREHARLRHEFTSRDWQDRMRSVRHTDTVAKLAAQPPADGSAYRRHRYGTPCISDAPIEISWRNGRDPNTARIECRAKHDRAADPRRARMRGSRCDLPHETADRISAIVACVQRLIALGCRPLSAPRTRPKPRPALQAAR